MDGTPDRDRVDTELPGQMTIEECIRVCWVCGHEHDPYSAGTVSS